MSQSHRSKYYFEDEMSVFLIENRLFKVHRHFLKRDSPVFQGMFACPSPPEGTEGRSDENPIPLPGVTCQEFEALLGFFYDRMYDRTLSLEELIDLLSVSTRFDFERIRQLAINTIGKKDLPPVDLIFLAEKYDVDQWLRRAYIALCQRREPLEVEEARKLGFEKTVLVAKAREKLAQGYILPGGVGGLVDKIFFPPHNDASAS